MPLWWLASTGAMMERILVVGLVLFLTACEQGHPDKGRFKYYMHEGVVFVFDTATGNYNYALIGDNEVRAWNYKKATMTFKPIKAFDKKSEASDDNEEWVTVPEDEWADVKEDPK